MSNGERKIQICSSHQIYGASQRVSVRCLAVTLQFWFALTALRLFTAKKSTVSYLLNIKQQFVRVRCFCQELETKIILHLGHLVTHCVSPFFHFHHMCLSPIFFMVLFPPLTLRLFPEAPAWERPEGHPGKKYNNYWVKHHDPLFSNFRPKEESNLGLYTCSFSSSVYDNYYNTTLQHLGNRFFGLMSAKLHDGRLCLQYSTWLGNGK